MMVVPGSMPNMMRSSANLFVNLPYAIHSQSYGFTKWVFHEPKFPEIMIILILSIAISLYVGTILELTFSIKKNIISKSYSSGRNKFISIIVVFRNEENNLIELLESFKDLDYPIDKFEIILVDDHSTDNSVKRVYDWRMKNGMFQFTLLENLILTKSPKKDAISRAMPIVKEKWLITTDADCVVPKTWLRALNQVIQNEKIAMVAMAVRQQFANGFLQHFQRADLTAMQGLTMGSFGRGLGFMCNGANFAYTKDFFQKLNGFSGTGNHAGGDDVFLLQKAVRKYPEHIIYTNQKDLIVSTKPVKSLGEIIHQKIRWASKTGTYQNVFAKDLAVIGFAGNFVIVIAIIFAAILKTQFYIPIIFFVLKYTCDLILIKRANIVLGSDNIKFTLFSAILYPFMATIVALLALAGRYSWKGRKFGGK